tara:strand:+ start:3478 stop:3657 length:180 start_codon:yes stop_codon:yes gene_type:complete
MPHSNPYIQQIVEQTGATPAEIRDALRPPLVVTDQVAQERGYSNAQEYEDALHEFLSGL